MSVAVNIISAVLKSAVGDKIGNELANEVIGISIDGVSEKGIDKINDFINGEKAKIEQALSRIPLKELFRINNKGYNIATATIHNITKITLLEALVFADNIIVLPPYSL